MMFECLQISSKEENLKNNGDRNRVIEYELGR